MPEIEPWAVVGVVGGFYLLLTLRDLGNFLVQTLASEDPEFCERFLQKFYGRTRRYVAKTKARLYRDAPRFEGMSHPLPGGWWLATHCANSQKVRWIKDACEVAGLEFGTELVAHIPSRTANKQEQPAS